MPFHTEDNIFDFVEGSQITSQGKAEMALHQSLTEAYEKRYQDGFSRIYSSYWNQQFISHLPDDCEMILDCGCGTGDLIREILPFGKQIVGMDISRDMIRVAKHVIPDDQKVTWVTAPGETFPFADRIFDVVCFRGALHHMTHENLALKEAYRTLRNGGTLLISEPNDDSLLLRLPRKIVNRHMARFGNDHKAFRSEPWLRTIRETGFSIQHTKYFSFLSQPLCGMSDILPLMKVLPYPEQIARFLVRFDEICSGLPVIQQQSFDLFIAAQKH